jgi:N12 class adenine-specific DNA methylase
MRVRDSGREDSLQLDLFQEKTNHEISDAIRLPGREILATLVAENGRGTGATWPVGGSIERSGGTNGHGNGRSLPPLPATGSFTGPGGSAGVGDCALSVCVSPPRELSEEANDEALVVDPQPIRNQNNYRITDRDGIGLGSLRRKCRANLETIALLKSLEQEQRQPDEEEKKVLVRYVGWGGLPQVFDSLNTQWTDERSRLESMLTVEEMDSARASTLNAHYTAPLVIRAIYALLQQLGFANGRLLEPACGLGHFIGLMPDEMHSRSQITGIEIDSITARITKFLYPDADIRHQPFEEARLADGFFDVAVSNIPFGDYKPFDPQFKTWGFVIHDYFFAKTLEKVRPGGFVLFITSKGTLDKLDGSLREYVTHQADFIGAIRLPNDAFKKNANTEVTTDIVVLRKRPLGEIPSGPAWKQVSTITNSVGEEISINEYYAARPHMMLGEMRLAGRMYRDHEPSLISNGRDLADQLTEAIARFPRNIFSLLPSRVAEPGLEQVFPAPEDVKPNAYTLVHDRIAIREGDQIRIVDDLPASRTQRIRGLIHVRDAVRRCLRTQLASPDDGDFEVSRMSLNSAYDHFVGKFGFISDRANTLAFRGDPDLPLLLSLENYDEQSKRAVKAAIFRERTIQRGCSQVEIKTAQDALLVTLGERGSVDLNHIAGLLHRKPSEFLPELQGAVFLNPQSNRWEMEDEYLSGNVRAKLAVAEAAALADESFRPNVAALKQVQPADLTPSEIDARLGSTWIPTEDIQSRAEELLGENGITVSHVPQLGLWVLRAGYTVKLSVANTTEHGTDRRTAIELLEDALNLRTPTVYDHDPDTDREVVDVLATEAARDKQQKIKDRFKDWIWNSDQRRERLARKYNDEFNNVRLRTFNGDHLRLPGASPTIQLRPHQRAAVWRVLQTPNCLLAHVVGAGKTYTMVAAAMELKRLGFARKPLFAVPNHMLGQFSSELLTLYPGANILVAAKEDFEKERRQTLMSRIATGNWDAVIVTHSGFEKIPVSRATQEEFINAELRVLSLAVEEQRKSGDSRIVKQLERAKKKLEGRLKELAANEKKDDTLTFEELGVDRLFVDEAHYFKNLFYVSKMTRIAGLPATASQRAFDMFLKVLHVQRMNSGAGVVFATGTPIANSVAEMFTMQRYLQMTALKAIKVDHFDSWAATFGEPVSAMELSPDGSGYRLNTRFARFINVPELMQRFRQVADIQTQKMLKLPVPELRTGKPIIVSAPCSKELKDIVQSLVERAEALRSGRIDPRQDNMLLVTTDGRKAALDLRLHQPELPDHATSKVNLAVDTVERIWRDTQEKRLAQLVFCDLSVPTNGQGFSVYEDMRDKLLARGVPADEIAFIQDHDSDAAKLLLFKDVRAGRVRILFGSTQKMGTGTNVQQRLIALHHLDAPWRPADVEQREGRILRQGNENPEVQIYRYVTEESFDAYMWQTLETKARFIAQVMTGENELRRIEDVDGAALTYAEVKAIASGNPMVIEMASVDAEVARLSRLRTQHIETQFRLRTQVRHLNDELPRLERRLAEIEDDIRIRHDTHGDAFVMEIDRQEIRDRGIAGELLLRHTERIKLARGDRQVGRFAGFQVFLSHNFMSGADIVLKGAGTHIAKVGTSALGTIRSVEHALQSLEESATAVQARITETRQRIEDLKFQTEQPFEYEAKLAALSKRQDEIEDALDLTKNQAAAQAQDALIEQNSVNDSPADLEPGEEIQEDETLENALV